MAIEWKPSTPEAHGALPKKGVQSRDTGWDTILDELQKGNVVMIEFHDDTERTVLGRSIRRRASKRGFKADIRQGDGYLSVSQAAAAGERKAREPRAGKEARARTAREPKTRKRS
jgi:hypothetical protein